MGNCFGKETWEVASREAGTPANDSSLLTLITQSPVSLMAQHTKGSVWVLLELLNSVRTKPNREVLDLFRQNRRRFYPEVLLSIIGTNQCSTRLQRLLRLDLCIALLSLACRSGRLETHYQPSTAQKTFGTVEADFNFIYRTING